MGRLLAGGDQHGVPIGTTGCIQESAESTEPVLDARWQGSNAGISLDGGAFTRQSNGNGGPGLEPGSMPASVPIPLAAAGACSGSQAFAGEDGAMTHSSSGCAVIPASQQLLPPNAPAQQQPLQVTQQPPDLGAGSPRANSRVQASMQAGAMEAPESQEQPRLDPLEGALSQGQGAVQQARSEPGLQPQPQEQRQQQAATQEHLHASPDGSSYKRPRRAAASKRHTSADMLYEDMGGGGGGWESLPGFEEGTVVLPGVHNPGGLVHTGSAGGSDSEGTRSEGGLETEDEEDIDEQEETDEDSSGESGSTHKRRRILPSRGRGRARGASSSRIAPASVGRGGASSGGGGGGIGDGAGGSGGGAAAGTLIVAPVAPGARASRGRSGGGGGRGQRSQRFTGVYHQACGRYRAQFCHGGMVHQLGMYDTEDQAAQAWDRVSWVYRGRPADLNFQELIHEYDKEDLKATVHEQMDERMAIYKPRGKNAKADAERERARTTAARSPEGPAHGIAPASPRGRPTGRAGATRKVPNSFIPPAQLPGHQGATGTTLGEASGVLLLEGVGSPPSSAAQSYDEARGHGARQLPGPEHHHNQQQQQQHHGAQGGDSSTKQGSGVAAAAEQQQEGGPIQLRQGRSKRGHQGGGAGSASAKLSLADLGDAAAFMMETEQKEDDRGGEGEGKAVEARAHQGSKAAGGGRQTMKKPRGQRTGKRRPTTSLKGLSHHGEEGEAAAAAAASPAASPPQQQQQQQQQHHEGGERSKRTRQAGASAAGAATGSPELGLGEAKLSMSDGGDGGGGHLQLSCTSQGFGADAAGAGAGGAGSWLLPGAPSSTGRDDLMLGAFPGLGLPSPSMSMAGSMGMAPTSHLFSPPGTGTPAMGGTLGSMWTANTLPGFGLGPLAPSSAAASAPHAFAVGSSTSVSQASVAPPPFAAYPPPNFMLPWPLSNTFAAGCSLGTLGGSAGATPHAPLLSAPTSSMPAPLVNFGDAGIGGGSSTGGGGGGSVGGVGWQAGAQAECVLGQSQGLPPPPHVPLPHPQLPHLSPQLAQGMCAVPASSAVMPPSSTMMLPVVPQQPNTLAAPTSSAAPLSGPPLSPQRRQQPQQLQLTPQQLAQQHQLQLAVQQQQQQELQRALQQQQEQQEQQKQQQQNMLWLNHQQQLRQHQAIWAQRTQQQQQPALQLPRSYPFAATSATFRNVRKLQPEDGGQWVGVLEDPQSLLILARHEDEIEAARLLACQPSAPLLTTNTFLEAPPSSPPLPDSAVPLTHQSHHHLHQQQQPSSQQVGSTSAIPCPSSVDAPLMTPTLQACPVPHPQNLMGLPAQPSMTQHPQDNSIKLERDLSSPAAPPAAHGQPGGPPEADSAAAAAAPTSQQQGSHACSTAAAPPAQQQGGHAGSTEPRAASSPEDNFLNFPPLAAPPNSTTPTIANATAHPLALPAPPADSHGPPQGAADQQQQPLSALLPSSLLAPGGFPPAVTADQQQQQQQQQEQQPPPSTPLPSSLLPPGEFPGVFPPGMFPPAAGASSAGRLPAGWMGEAGLLDAGMHNPLASPGNEDHLSRLLGLLGVPTPPRPPSQDATPSPSSSWFHHQQQQQQQQTANKDTAAPAVSAEGGVAAGAASVGGVDGSGAGSGMDTNSHSASEQQRQQQMQQLQRAQRLLQAQQQQHGRQQQAPSPATTRFLNRPAPPPLDLGAILGANQALQIHQQQQQQLLLQQHAPPQSSPPAPSSAAASAPGTPPALQQQHQQQDQQQQQQQEGGKEQIVHATLAPAAYAATADPAAAAGAAAVAAASSCGVLPMLSSRASKDSCSMAFMPLHATGAPREGHAGIGGSHSAQHQGSGDASPNNTLSNGVKLQGSGQGCSPQHTPGHSSHHHEHDSPGPTSSHSLISTPAPSLPSPHSKPAQHASTHAPRPQDRQQQQ